MRLLVLGLPGSGTSAVAECLYRGGYSNCPPTFAKGDYGYETHESLLGRAINRIGLSAPKERRDWDVERWNDYYRPRNPYADSELKTLAEWWVHRMDVEHHHWFFKNPESLLLFRTLWYRFEWTEIIGVYRHPEEAIKTLHSAQKACYRRNVWNRYSKILAAVSTRLYRFPDDIPALAEDVGADNHLTDREHVSRSDPGNLSWCASAYKALEEKRWLNISGTRT